MTFSAQKIGKLLLPVFLLISSIAQAQMVKPPKWTFSLEPKELQVGEKATLVMEAEIPMGWYVYSNDFDKDLGPLLTEFIPAETGDYAVEAKLKAINPKKKFDEVWEGEVTYFIGKGRFEQPIIIKATSGTIKGSLEYQMCSDLTGQCINYEQDIEIKFTAKESSRSVTNSSPTSPEAGVKPDLKQETEKLSADSSNSENIEGESPFSLSPASGEAGQQEGEAGQPITEPQDFTAEGEKESLWGFMVLAFLAGLAALITPCVFPMIPMTVSFFTGRSKSRAQGIRQAFIYGFSIIAIYTVAGTAVAAIQGPEFANWLATHWIPNVFFFLIFIFFALAFLGMFELTLPSSFVNKIDAKAEKGGLGGVFFMAFTLVLVSFSCTGPIVGSILISSAGGELIKPVLGMFAFGLAFAIPFTLFAIFPGWMQRLPKSGGWLNTVKVVLGFLELALAFKFLSIADLVYHWGILDRDIFLAIWIVIFSALGFYLLGKIKLPHDSKLEYISVPRLLLALLTFTFVVHMIPGLWGAPLKLLSGYLPPITTQQFKLTGGAGSEESFSTSGEVIKYADRLKIPHGIPGYFDYEQALEAAKREGKPLLIDFTGHGCVNCRKMEENVWVDPQVLKRLKEDFVMVALYIDERLDLPESDWYTSSYDNKVKKTLGKQNADFQITRFNNNAQPFYVILDHKEQLLAKPRGYNTDIAAFVEFLDGAKKIFNEK
ncbi:cytochrome c biogenesis protein CcdA [Algoriphagus sp.]|jgi:thiol:disulfide interchange protein DsbD|uniref:protein-disulfide reductase DsbD family protein n=1 Tax=Algoriphagus sp. TaxID=1872435 RepID=UPI002726CD0E|nr:cytochrome c biogenesis protein CcdA [Algoriphagus sp.]MDO8966503.1 cytochrome c biogenesis protein CcdA [Algoriphagus sp.]MDP3201949.1 cytochrome c biogenesis protein CcdA [Algoriphagus sp.]